MGAPNNENNPDVISCHVGTVSTAGDYPLVYIPKKFVLKSAHLLNKGAIAADGTNYVTATLKNGSTTLGTVDTNSAGGNASVEDGVAESFGVEETTLDAGSTLKLTYAEGGTGTLTDAKVCLYGYYL